VQTNLHPETCNFTKAAICSNKQGKYAQTHDWIFENQEGLSLSKMENLKKQVVLDGAALDSCMQSSEIDAEIQKQISRAIMANVEATPSIFANGKFLPHGYLIPVLEKVLNNVAPK
jgi:protein-disulfide isomerase